MNSVSGVSVSYDGRHVLAEPLHSKGREGGVKWGKNMDVCLLILRSILKCNNLVFHFKKYSNNNLVRATMQEHNPTFFPPFSPSFPPPPSTSCCTSWGRLRGGSFPRRRFRAEEWLFELRASPCRPNVLRVGFRTSAVNLGTLNYTN